MRVVPETLVRGQSEVPRLVIVARNFSAHMHAFAPKEEKASGEQGNEMKLRRCTKLKLPSIFGLGEDFMAKLGAERH